MISEVRQAAAVHFSAWRKVRAPESRMPANGRAPRGDRQWHRKHTADGPARLVAAGDKVLFEEQAGNRRDFDQGWSGRDQARVKRRGKSPPQTVATRLARKTSSGARPNREAMAWLAPLPGRLLLRRRKASLERRGNASPRGMAAGQLRLPYRTRLIGGLPSSSCGGARPPIFILNFHFIFYPNCFLRINFSRFHLESIP